MARKVYVGADDFTPRELPEGYVQLEWIGSSGYQYIKTGLKMKSGYRVVAEFRLTATDSWTCMFGADDTATNTNSFALWHTGTAFAYYFGTNKSKNFPTSIVTTDWHTIDCAGNSATLDGNTVSCDAANFTGAQELYLFAVNYGGEMKYPSYTEYKRFEVYDENGGLIGDYVPCKDSSGAAGVFDMVSGLFIGNSGVGVFTTGAELRVGIARNTKKMYVGRDTITKRVAWIEGTGTQFIDTMYKPRSEKLRIRAEFIHTAAAGARCAFGAQEGNGFSMTLYGMNEIICGTGGTIFRHARPEGERTMFDITLDNGRVYGVQNGVVVSGAYSGSVLKTKSIGIFYNNGGPESQICPLKVCFFQIYDDDVLVRDYVASRTEQNEYGLHDLVENLFYGNDGTGAFSGEDADYAENYVEVEYIESVGGQYIDTLLPGMSGLKVKARLSPSAVAASIPIGCYGPERFYMLSMTDLGVARYGYVDWLVSDKKLEPGEWYDIEIVFAKGEQSLKVNGELVATSLTETNIVNGHSVFLFAYNDAGKPGDHFIGKVEFLRFYTPEGTLLRDYRAYKDSAGAGGLYDMVGLRFYKNSGTGAFLTGPEKIDGEEGDSGAILSSVCRSIKKGYIGIGKIARPFWGEDNLPTSYGTITALSAARQNCASENIGGFAVFAGGDASSVKSPSSDVDAYNASLVRSAVTALSVARTNIASARTDSHMIVSGGSVNGSTYSDAVDAYSESLVRVAAPSMSIARCMLAGAEAGGYAIFAGGVAGEPRAEAEAYSNSLTRLILSPLSEARYGLSGEEVGGHAVFAGGYLSDRRATVDVYNESLVRSVIEPLSVARDNAVSVRLGDRIIIAGGKVGLVEQRVVDVYNDSLVRSSASELSVARNKHAGTALGHFALFYGGSEYGAENVVDVYNSLMSRSTIDATGMKDRYGLSAETIGEYALFAGGVGPTNEVGAFTIL